MFRSVPARSLPLAWLALALGVAWGAPALSGEFQVAVELGVHAGPGLGLQSGDNDRPARCDEFVNPRYAELEGCTDAYHGAGAVDDWINAFDRPRGVFAGVALGYRPNDRWRLELEAVQRVANVDQTASTLTPDAGVPFTRIFGAELPSAWERIDTLQSRNVFANVYREWPGEGRWTPFVGVGIGVAFASLEYAVRWERSGDPATVETAAGLPNEDEVRRNLAGTVSRASRRLRDTLRGWQLLAGGSYAISPAWSLAVQGRWASFEAFEDGGSYAELRGHASNLRLDGSEPVAYRVSTEDLGFASIGLRLQRRF